MVNKFFNIFKEEVEFGGRVLSLETGHVARQADGAVVAKYGDTVVLCTVVAEKKAKAVADFFPLTVHYQEKAFAAGRIPGGFFKREGKPSESEVLTSRLIDRPIRPLFPENFYNEVQVICTVLSHDMENNPDIVAIIGACAALEISGIPFASPVCAARVGLIGEDFILNPTISQIKESKLDLVVAGTKDGVLMVESEASQLTEEQMLNAVKFGHESFAPVLKAIASLKKSAGKKAWDIAEQDADYEPLAKEIKKIAKGKIESAYDIKEKLLRRDAVAAIKEEVIKEITSKDKYADEKFIAFSKRILDSLEYELLRSNILDNEKRIDGRKLDEVRPIHCEVGVLPRAHGSALFTRGETQALVVTTLGSGDDEQLIDSLTGEYKENFMVHYNFPPYSVGETGRLSSPGRREIGHGKLAWRALHPLIPNKNSFPYTIRLVSEVTESNGSSSMATVCGSSLAIMDAGVSLASPISGIAMGLIKEGKKFAVLTDIQGDEDHLGDMDFKVAGTAKGITALQMDIKITSITFEIMQIALEQAKAGREHIANEMSKAIEKSRENLSAFAPQIVTKKINKDKIRDVIGPGGKVIREICEKTGAKIEINDDGNLSVFGNNKDAIKEALVMIEDIVGEPEIGKIYSGPVVKIAEFGAFVNFFGKQDGLVHISEISTERVENIDDVLKVGDIVKVVLLDIDERTRKYRLSIKAVSTGYNPSNYERKPRSSDDRGGGDRRGSGGGGGFASRPPRSGDDRRSGGGGDRRGSSSGGGFGARRPEGAGDSRGGERRGGGDDRRGGGGERPGGGSRFNKR